MSRSQIGAAITRFRSHWFVPFEVPIALKSLKANTCVPVLLWGGVKGGRAGIEVFYGAGIVLFLGRVQATAPGGSLLAGGDMGCGSGGIFYGVEVAWGLGRVLRRRHPWIKHGNLVSGVL
ncbi:hypothetical protein CPC08DRAFT_725958 [Agrocybe pediades]|nr:hypothetical protein CPC08DRAFT_725958 [Agrocybe pediades]